MPQSTTLPDVVPAAVPSTPPAPPVPKVEICEVCRHLKKRQHINATGYGDEQPWCMYCFACRKARAESG